MPKIIGKIKPGKSKDSIEAYMVKLNSNLDLARYACDFGTNSEPINVFKITKEQYILFSRGERIGKKSIIYYTETDKIGKLGIYRHGDLVEDFYMIDNMRIFENFKYYRIPMIEIESMPFKDSKAKKDSIISIKIKDFDSMVKEAISTAIKNETIAKLYAFTYKSERILGSFDFMQEDDTKIFWYSSAETNEKFNFLRYDYNNDVVEHINASDENPSYIYVKVINLAGPFPFF